MSLHLKRSLVILSTCASLVALVSAATAEVPTLVNYQGFLQGSAGSPVTGTVSMRFALYSSEVGGEALWSETQAAVSVQSGVFTVLLGSANALNPSIFTGARLWLETSLESLPLAPRQPLGTTPYAFHAATADAGILSNTVEAPLTITGHSTPMGTGETILNMGGWEVIRAWGIGVQDLTFSCPGAARVKSVTFEGPIIVHGITHTEVLEITGGSDLAEPFDVSALEDPQPGMLVSIDPENPGGLRLAAEPYDCRVAGIISGANGLNPGMVMRAEGVADADGARNIALTGRVWCWAEVSNGVIEPGDLLTTSATPGYAMKVTDHERAYGAVIGKSMSSLKEGAGLVLVLVQPR